ncbi:hypothetical protein HK099_004586 [Clydaea vesicula]|uniref:Glutamate pyruvate transaminase n=1 Tax=Clydaea vesicula TaxID=447962 RepID=A0AAD5U2V0_9FUNG|nr:hypothetical protein HK099_004586 [Clydaea vesicula]
MLATKISRMNSKLLTKIPALNLSSNKTFTLDKANQQVKNVNYAVRGELAIRAEFLRSELNKTSHDFPFQYITNCNIGNPQQLNQKPITFFRQVLSLIDNPDLILEENLHLTKQLYPPDAITRAKTMLAALGSSGSYTHSQGIPLVRENVAKFIEERDGYPSNPDHIFLTAGASPGVQTVLQTLIEHAHVGVICHSALFISNIHFQIMIPIPQYPLYTAAIDLFNGTAVPYYLDEEDSWGMSIAELKKSIKQARELSVDVRALCVINPGNPTGQCLTERNIRETIAFCKEEGLVLLADEVYQKNTYAKDLPFHSFKKVLRSMGDEYKDFELISFHSVSKGMVGECGRRGGYFECTGIQKEVMDLFYKISSVSLCPPVPGQIMVDLMVNPPKSGDFSFESYTEELNAIYNSLASRAEKLAKAFNELEGITCNYAQGAMYLFPQIRPPPKAIEEAKKQGRKVDEMYCMELLNATGVFFGGDNSQQEEEENSEQKNQRNNKDYCQGYICPSNKKCVDAPIRCACEVRCEDQVEEEEKVKDLEFFHVFPKNQYNVISSGKKTELLLGLKNKGSGDQNIREVYGYFTPKDNFNKILRNLTRYQYPVKLEGGDELTIPYIFLPEVEPSEYGLVVIVEHFGQGEDKHRSVAFQDKVKVVGSDSYFDFESISIYIIGLLLAGFLFKNYFGSSNREQSKKQKKQQQKLKSEERENEIKKLNEGELDEDWIPQLRKSPRLKDKQKKN